MNKMTRSMVAAICAMFAAWLATQFVSWHTLPKACLAGAVAGTVMAIFLFTFLVKPTNDSK